jgi:hypothetical protein
MSLACSADFVRAGWSFRPNLVLPYRNESQSIPMHGQFLLVQLETPTEAVLGRIASFSSEGKLSFGSGEEFNIRALRENRDVPEDLREQYRNRSRRLSMPKVSADRVVGRSGAPARFTEARSAASAFSTMSCTSGGSCGTDCAMSRIPIQASACRGPILPRHG